MKHRIAALASALALVPGTALAAQSGSAAPAVGTGGASALWVLANFSYAGMRAQNSSSHGWRVAAFIFGFPGTLISFLAVPEGGNKVYGVHLPRPPGSFT